MRDTEARLVAGAQPANGIDHSQQEGQYTQGSHKAQWDEIEWKLMGTRGALSGKVEMHLLGDL